MFNSTFRKTSILATFLTLFFIQVYEAQTKRLKRPRSSVGISSVDQFVKESFDLYDKVYKYDGYAKSQTPLDDEDIDVLEEALSEVSELSEVAPNIINDLDGEGLFKQGKATLQINKAKKALTYSVQTVKELLAGERNIEEESESEDVSEKDSQNDQSGNDDNLFGKTSENAEESSNISDDLEILGKYDFVPGDKVLFFDDFAREFIGDFPSRWNTNASGEVVEINSEKWFELSAGHQIYFIPDFKGLPEDYTVEFDLLSKGIDNKTSSNVNLYILLSDTDDFVRGLKNYSSIAIPFAQYRPFAIQVVNFFNGKRGKINVSLNADIRNEVLNKPHISISVTKQRFRLWVNEVKYADIPRLVEQLDVLEYVKFNLYGAKEGKERVFINNIRIAEGGQDLRRQLLSEGKISTNGILFDSGSANIKKQSYGIIRQISQVLKQDDNTNLKIIGHTDSDGTAENNLELSKTRAAAVRDALITVYQINSSRLKIEGKGETEAVSDNSTAAGKAENRRVEFILL